MNDSTTFLSRDLAEHLELRESATRFLSENYSLERRRKTVGSGRGYDRDIWGAFADLGWLAIPFPESDGGLEGGSRSLASLMTALGPAAVVEPYLDGVVLAGSLLSRCPAGPLRSELIETTIAGKGYSTVAILDLSRRTPDQPTTLAASWKSGAIELRGQATLVPGASQCDTILVPARDSDDGSLAIYAVPPSEAKIDSYPMLDGGLASDVTLDGIRVPASHILADSRTASDALEHALRMATYCACVEGVSIMETLIRASAQYICERKQFGRQLSEFQALQHMLADMTIAYARADASTWMAGQFIDSTDSNQRDRVLAAAKYEMGQSGRFIGQRAVQLHGAIGMTDELIIGHHFKRLVSLDLLYGGWLNHLQRFAAFGLAS